MATTLTQLRTLFYNVLREAENASNYPHTLADSFINAAQLDFCSWMIKNPFTWEVAKKGVLPFLRTDKFYSNIAPITLSTTTSVWATTLTVSDTTNYPSAGKIYIWGNIITYTGKTSTTFTWCSNVLFARTSWNQISPVFDLPADFMSPIQLIYNNRAKITCQNYDDVYETLRDYKGYSLPQEYYNNTPYTAGNMLPPFYTIKDWSYLILWNLTATAWSILFRYDKTPTTLSSGSDTATIDNDTYAQIILPQYAVSTMLYHRWEEARAKEILNYVLPMVKQAYAFYNNKGYENQSWYWYTVGKNQKILNI